MTTKAPEQPKTFPPEGSSKGMMVHWLMEVHRGDGKSICHVEMNVPVESFVKQRELSMQILEEMLLAAAKQKGFALPAEVQHDHEA